VFSAALQERLSTNMLSPISESSKHYEYMSIAAALLKARKYLYYSLCD
jgi:hypothetical protein